MINKVNLVFYRGLHFVNRLNYYHNVRCFGKILPKEKEQNHFRSDIIVSDNRYLLTPEYIFR